MASLVNDPAGRKRIQFYDQDGKRKTIRLGKCSLKDGNIVRAHIEHLVSARFAGISVPMSTLNWLNEISPTLKLRIIRTGLVAGVEPPRKITHKKTLVECMDEYLARRKDSVRPTTYSNWTTQRNRFAKDIGEDLPLKELTISHGRDWIDLQASRNKSQLTTSLSIQWLSQVLNDAVERKFITENPFSKLKVPQKRKITNVEVSRETVYLLIKSAQNHLKTVLVLTRFGGLRCPSEVLSLRWEHIDWSRSVISIPEPKKDRPGLTSVRLCPLFPEIRSHLEPIKQESGYVVEFFRDKEFENREWHRINLKGQLKQAQKNAKIQEWPRAFHSLRASRQTELEREFGLAAACAWIGNSEKVAQEHYLLIESETWAKAAQNPARKASKTE